MSSLASSTDFVLTRLAEEFTSPSFAEEICASIHELYGGPSFIEEIRANMAEAVHPFLKPMESLNKEEDRLTKRARVSLEGQQIDIPIPMEMLECIAPVKEQVWKALNISFENLSKENEKLKKENEDLRKENEDLEQKNLDSHGRFRVKELEIATLQAELDATKMTLERAQSDLEMVQKEALEKESRLHNICNLSRIFMDGIERVRGMDNFE
ncbi:hypothetical protein Tsubulata_037631 [Turnera subulata]|uniref:Uncharacterized protein n=1 Tax=Turnera subulata TaxID=218843 RepID=A0A9Q0F4S5_9ROSI|nr:hypothetical protein Tsubulata_037631 [Turnera subulata]